MTIDNCIEIKSLISIIHKKSYFKYTDLEVVDLLI